ncbi:MAG TPA: hypothetical protein VNC40_10420 [Gaiellaceae bacterium]|nr:hypothetical protein [Gaiellaceae bacterium]
MKLLALAAVLFTTAAPVKAVELAIVHTVHGCHIWQTTRNLGAATTLTLKRGGRITLRVSCPMDFKLAQLRGPKLVLGNPVLHTGTQRSVTFPRNGVYVISATNLQTSAEVGLQTLGPDNVLRLTVTVR